MDSYKQKKLLAAAAVFLLVAAAAAVTIINNKASCGGTAPDSAVSASDARYLASGETLGLADFPMQYSDRLCGYPATGYYADSGTAEVEYAGIGFTRKTLAPVSGSDEYDAPAGFERSYERDINGVNATFYGNGNKVYMAVWTANNFVYVISLDQSTGGIDAAEMTEYVMATN